MSAIVAVATALTLAGCGDDDDAGDASNGSGGSIAGTYLCGPPGEPEVDTATLDDDGTVTIRPTSTGDAGSDDAAEGTWSVDGDRGTFTFDGRSDPFSVNDGRIEFDDGFVCTPDDSS